MLRLTHHTKHIIDTLPVMTDPPDVGDIWMHPGGDEVYLRISDDQGRRMFEHLPQPEGSMIFSFSIAHAATPWRSIARVVYTRLPSEFIYIVGSLISRKEHAHDVDF